MAAPDLLTLFKYEDQIEAAVVAVLEAVSVPAVRHRDSASLSTPRTEAKLHMGAPTGHRFVPPGAHVSPSHTYADAFNAQLVLTTITNRDSPLGNGDRHEELVAKSRVVMLQPPGTLNLALEYLSILFVNEAGVIPDIRAGESLDVSPVVFTIQFCIRGEAWPVEVTG